jgi:UDP-2,4-diacetamido-2,4,6-trideoxy-beta-L-altropyranose hydrolase
MRKKIYLRTDGNIQVGLGHIYRCIALAQLLDVYFESIFITQINNTEAQRLIREAGFNVFLISQTNIVESEVSEIKTLLTNEDILVLDGYDFGTAYQKSLKPHVRKLLIIDDEARHHMYADVVFNYSIDESEVVYSYEAGTQLCLGLKYLILRGGFLDLSRKPRKPRTVETVFVCLGGSDADDYASFIIDILEENFAFSRIILLTGAANKWADRYIERMSKGSWKNVEHLHCVDTLKLIDLLAISDLAITPSSTIALEAMAAKVPVVLGITASNQQYLCNQLVAKGCGKSLGHFDKKQPDKLIEAIEWVMSGINAAVMQQKQSEHINGYSKERILDVFNSFI